MLSWNYVEEDGDSFVVYLQLINLSFVYWKKCVLASKDLLITSFIALTQLQSVPMIIDFPYVLWMGLSGFRSGSIHFVLGG